MSLGERIGQYRRSLGVSQEELGARLGVSRQAVSKWETNAATPDMANLIALAQEFGVSVAELTETPEQLKEEKKSWENLRLFLFPILISLLTLALFALGLILWTNFRPDTPPPAAPPPEDTASTGDATPTRAPVTDFALIWSGSHGHEEFLELGTQETFFPFGAALELTEPEEVLDTDFTSMTAHRADCGAISIEYSHIEDASETGSEIRKWENIDALSTIVPGYATPRGIAPGSSEADLLAAYGDELVYCLNEEGYTLVPHDYFYAWSAFADGYSTIFFYVEGRNVSGIRMERMYDLGNFYTPNNISRFPVRDGQPDFSLREEPEREELSDTQRVYIAFNQLVTNNNLTAEERYAYRRDIFALLPDMDWWELGQMGTAEYPDDAIFALMDWLTRQDPYTESEILWIQLGCTAKGLDGAYTDAYCQLLAHIFFYDPVTFAKNLNLDGLTEEEKLYVLRFTAYDAEWHPAELQTALDTLDQTLTIGYFTEQEAGWAKLLRLYLTTPVDDRYELPKSPSELP